MIEVYRTDYFEKIDYSQFKNEIRTISDQMRRLELENLISDYYVYYDIHDISKPVMDIRILKKENINPVKEVLDKAKNLEYKISEIKYKTRLF